MMSWQFFYITYKVFDIWAFKLSSKFSFHGAHVNIAENSKAAFANNTNLMSDKLLNSWI